ncbi:P-loop containing nucleoside triphosphate hydrolase protein [Choiromyces venosus 120613-1]|uniref:P-loop containing nucleoside triphosphate hydrolase protein n=1 Tax=Choiromyces venosus 120613-1 TaxID=1336337 RepID=A0A3N4JNN7_9PEZI|nr:P-loop containing nucleoside triphosphate hydrolase protein [Choiromyces venosus 120613-1]
MPREKKPTPATIQATSQQTRFNLEETASKELDLKGVHISIGKREIVSDAHLRLAVGVHYVLVGRNGVGKSTLLRAIGEKLIPGIAKNLRILFLQQSYDSEEGREGEKKEEGKQTETVLEFVVRSDRVRADTLRRFESLKKALDNTEDPTDAVRLLRMLKHEGRLTELEEAKKAATLRSGTRGMKARKELKALEVVVAEEEAQLQIINDETVAEETDEAINLLGELETALESMSAATAEARAQQLLLGLGFTPKMISLPLTSLSGGWRMRTTLASLLFQPCDILLLDEPTNFLDLPSLLWLETHLQSLTDTILLLVTHDRAFADTLADEIIVLRDTKLERFPGNLTAYETARSENQRRLTRMKEAQDRQKEHMEATIAGNVRAARVSGDDKKLKQAASRQKKLDERMGYQVGIRGGRFKLNRDLPGYHTSARDEIEIPVDDPAARLAVPSTPSELRFPGALVSCENLSFTYPGASAPVLDKITLTIHLGDRIGLVGLNGAGKSTLVSCLVETQPRSGKITGTLSHHPKSLTGYFSQAAIDSLPLDQTTTTLSHLGGEEHEARALLASLGLVGATVSEIPISRLSGGQKVRVALARVLHPPPHLLVLDEVTTHLDADSVVTLAEGLKAFEGAVVLISHDRWFVKDVIEEEGKNGRVYQVGSGKVRHLAGGVAAFEKRVRKSAKGNFG